MSCIYARPYETFEGSPASQGILQFDMWGRTLCFGLLKIFIRLFSDVTPDSGRWDWSSLKEEIKKNGMRNSLLIAPMPTASKPCSL